MIDFANTTDQQTGADECAQRPGGRRTADPHGFPATYILAAREHGLKAREVFLVWLLSLGREEDAALVAGDLLETYGDAMAAAGTVWHSEFLELLEEAARWPAARIRRIRRPKELADRPM